MTTITANEARNKARQSIAKYVNMVEDVVLRELESINRLIGFQSSVGASSVVVNLNAMGGDIRDRIYDEVVDLRLAKYQAVAGLERASELTHNVTPKCVDKLSGMLRERGFTVRSCGENRIEVSWEGSQ